MKTLAIMASAASGAFLLALGAQAADAPKAVIQLAQASAPTAARIAQIYEERCKFCHEPAVDRAPSREAMGALPPSQIAEALTRGVMQPMADGLSPAEIQGLAAFLGAKPAAAPPPAAAPAAPAQGAARPAAPPAARAVGTQPDDVKCAVNPPIKTASTDWNGYGKDLVNTRYQPNTSITPANVGKLKVKWAFSFAGGRHGQPTIIGDHLFITGGAGHVYSLDAKTGCVHWRAMMEAGGRTSPVVERRPGASPSGWMLYVGDSQRNVYGLDAMTGQQIWKINVDKHPRGVLTGSPILYKDRLYVPVSSLEETIASVASYGCCTFSGAVAAIDLNKKEMVWKTQMLDPPQPTRKNAAGTQMFGPAGAAIWSQPTIDAKRNQIYVATGDSYTEVDANRSDAVVALDMTTGKIKWHNQVTKYDNFLVGCGGARPGINCPLGPLGPDVDFGASPILREVGKMGMVVAGQKSGVVYGFDADTGAMQYFTKVGEGGALGGIEWGMAADGKAVYAGVADIIIAPEKAKPGLNAVDFKTGKVIWHLPAPKPGCSFSGRCHNGFSAPVSAAPGLVFAGTQDGWLRAVDSKNGKILWDFNTAGQKYKTTNGVQDQPGGGIDGSGPVISGGHVYQMSGVSLAAGVGSIPVSVLLAFSVDGK